MTELFGVLDPGLAAAVALGIVGLVIGSFLNVVIWRVPRGESVVAPPSACPSCGARIAARDNVPVLSWLLLRGRCRSCRSPISARYPLVESACAVLFVVVVVRLGVAWELPAYLYLAAVGLALALIDIDVHRLPDAIVLPSYPVLAVLLTLASWNPGGESRWGDLARAGAGAAILGVAYFVMVVVYPAGMGLGDVKLAGLLGGALGWLGWGELVVGGFAAFLLGGIAALLLLAMRRVRLGSGIPFGPWMLLGAAIGIGWGSTIWGGYLGLVGL